MTLEDIKTEDLDSLFWLFQSQTEPALQTPKNFNMWLLEEGYIDE